MTPKQIKWLREAIGLTQTDLAAIVGAHAITVSKWERGVASPTAFQAGILAAINRLSDRERETFGPIIRETIIEQGAVRALHVLLQAAFG